MIFHVKFQFLRCSITSSTGIKPLDIFRLYVNNSTGEGVNSHVRLINSIQAPYRCVNCAITQPVTSEAQINQLDESNAYNKQKKEYEKPKYDINC